MQVNFPKSIGMPTPLPVAATPIGRMHSTFSSKMPNIPYVQEKPFDWIRGYQVGGKSLMWARGTQRWSQYRF